MNINQKGFANIVLIVLVVILAGALGYVTLVKKTAPTEQSQTNNSQNTRTIANRENVEYHIEIQGNPTYKTVSLSDVSKYGISSNNFVTTSGAVVFLETRTDGTHSPKLVLKDSSATEQQISLGGGYILVPVAKAFWNDFAPVFSQLKIGDTVQVWGSVGMAQGVLVTSASGTMIETRSGGIAGAPYFGVISLHGIKKE